jgi:hypothetical protein
MSPLERGENGKSGGERDAHPDCEAERLVSISRRKPVDCYNKAGPGHELGHDELITSA